MKALAIVLLIGLCAAAQAEIVIYSNSFDGVDASPIVYGGGNSANGFRVVITNAAGTIQSIQGNGSAATVINSSGTAAGLFPTAGVNNFPSVGSTNAFHMRADFVIGTVVTRQMGYGLFSKTTWTAANGGYARMQFGIDAVNGGGYLQPINIAKTGVGTGNDAPTLTFDSSGIGAWSASDTYRLSTDFTFNTTKGQTGVAGSSGTNYWSVSLTLKNLNTGKEVTKTTTSPEWLVNSLYMYNLANGTAEVALYLRGTSTVGISVDNFVVTQDGVIPEPALIGLVGAAAMALLRRRNR